MYGPGRRNRSFLIHKCDIERSFIIADVSNIRDRRIERWDVLYRDVKCWFEHTGSTIFESDQFGKVPVERYNVHFEGSPAIFVNDRLRKGTDYYVVEAVIKYSDEDWHILATVRKMNYRQQL